MTKDEIVAAIDFGVREFGRYTLIDKGADEVIETSPILNHLKSLDGCYAGALLMEILDHYGDDDEGIAGRVVGDLICDLQEQPEEWWDAMMSHKKLQEHF